MFCKTTPFLWENNLNILMILDDSDIYRGFREFNNTTFESRVYLQVSISTLSFLFQYPERNIRPTFAMSGVVDMLLAQHPSWTPFKIIPFCVPVVQGLHWKTEWDLSWGSSNVHILKFSFRHWTLAEICFIL